MHSLLDHGAMATMRSAEPVVAGVPFIVNGRFLSQTVTGVQRYALEIVRELDCLLSGTDQKVDIAVPRGAVVEGRYRHLRLRRVTPLQGHAWEQVVLPLSCEAPLLSLCNLAPLMARRSVVCIHDANVFMTRNSYSRAFQYAYRLLLPRIARRATVVTSVSRHAARTLESRLGLYPDSITVLSNGHEHALRWRPDKSVYARQVREWPRYVLAIGSLARHKNLSRVHGLADALKGIGLGLVVAGSERGPFAATGRSEADNVRFLGRVSDDDLACLMEGALCLAFPSRQEGFGLPIVEAMARGCPVVASTASCLPEICDTAALMADPDSDEHWLRHFENLLRSKDLRDEMSARGRANVRRYSWRQSARGYLDLMANA